MRVPLPDELGALLLEHGRQRGGAGADHEVAEMTAYKVLEPECKLRVGLLSGGLAERGAVVGRAASVGWVFPAVFFIGGSFR